MLKNPRKRKSDAMNIKYIVIGLLLICGILFSASENCPGPGCIKDTLGAFCNTLHGALAVGMMLLIVLAAIVYAVGQVMGAETRARASVWATAMFVGALIGALIYIILPYILSCLAPDLFGSGVSCGSVPDWKTLCSPNPVTPP